MNKQILKLAIPNILTNISIPLLSSIDAAVVGHLDNVAYLGAVAIGSMIFNVIYWGFGFLRMGTTGFTAQAFGQKEDSLVATEGGRAMFIAVVAGVALIILQPIIEIIAFQLISASHEVEQFARSYFRIRIFAAPATLAVYVFHGWFLGMQNSKFPMILLVSVNLLNIFFNLLFIYHFGMKSDGVALGTVLAQYSGLLISIGLTLIKYRYLVKQFVFLAIFEKEKLRRFFKVNTDIFIRTLALMLTLSFFTAESATYGNNILAANTILLQFWMVLSFAIDGFAFAAESLVGKYFGEKNQSSLKEAIKKIFIWGISISVLFSIFYWAFGKQIIFVFTDLKSVQTAAFGFLIWVIISPVINSISFIWDGIYIGATSSATMRNVMLASALLFFFPAYFLLKPLYGNHALWFALVLFMITRAIFMTIFAKKAIFQ